jgi:GT2 family glycosyltransferase
MRSVAIVITAYKRDAQLANTLASISWQCPDEVIVVDDAHDASTESLCRRSGVSYIQRLDRPDVTFSNPAVPINIGLRAAKSDIVVLQNAECLHQSNVVEQFRERVKEKTALFAKVQSLNQDGSFERWYTAPGSDERPYFFCGAMLRKHFLELGGMDEDFTGPGFEDDDFALRMQQAGIGRWFAADILVTHQWHERPVLNSTPSYELYQKKHGGRVWL